MEKSPSSKHISENKKAEILIIPEDSSFLILAAEILTIKGFRLFCFYQDCTLFLILSLTFQPFRDIINSVN